VTGSDWAVVVGGAGDASIAEHAMREMERKLLGRRALSEKTLLDVTDKILDSIYTKYVDKDKDSEGLSLVLGAVCGGQLHLISTTKRVPQVQDFMAYAGIGADIGIFLIDRLHQSDADWTYSAKVVGLTLQQATEARRFCGGESEIYVLQRPPNSRWRSLGTGDAPVEMMNGFSPPDVSKYQPCWWNLPNIYQSFCVAIATSTIRTLRIKVCGINGGRLFPWSFSLRSGLNQLHITSKLTKFVGAIRTGYFN
jgi:hypothetical protein